MNNWRALERQQKQSKSRQQAEQQFAEAFEPKKLRAKVKPQPTTQFHKVLSEFAGQCPTRQAAAIKRMKPRHIDQLIEALEINRQEAFNRCVARVQEQLTEDGFTVEDLVEYLSNKS